MRPLKLTLSAFGPYASEQVFDFRVLGDRSFFLIHGPTGSGKSTLLDAVCFALYGETSGGERDVRHLRSDYARAGTPTRVTFDFSLGEAVYRITRSPEQERPRARGEGTVVQRPAAVLHDRTGLVDESREGTLLADQWTRVTDRMEQLLGFKSSQFRQVVMLPQGQFRKFLTADSRERQAILEVLFQTGIYRRIEEAVKEAAREIQHALEDFGKRRRLILEQAAVESERQLAEAMEGFAERLEALGGQVETLKKNEALANEAVNKGREIRRILDEAARAQAEFAALEKRKPEIEDRRVKLDRARKAAGLRGVEANLAAREKEFGDASVRVRTAEVEIEKARAARQAEETALAGEREREGEREAARRDVVQLTAMIDQVRELEAARSDLGGMKARVERIERLRGLRAAALERCRAEMAEAGAALEETEAQAVHAERYRLEVRQAAASYRTTIRLKTSEKHLALALARREKTGAAAGAALAALTDARTALDGMEKKWLDGQAAILAGRLADGVPCPVCGATDHPSPAGHEGELPTEAALKKARTHARELESRYEKARLESERANLEVAALQSAAGNLRAEAGEVPAEGFRDLKTRLRDAWARFRTAVAARAQVTDRAVALKSVEERTAGNEKRLRRLEDGLRAAVRRMDGQAAVMAEREGKVPDRLRDLKALERAISTAQKRLRSLLDAQEAARARHEAAAARAAACEETLRNAVEALEFAKERAGTCREELRLRLAEEGFSSVEDYRAAKLDGKDVDRMEREIADFHGRHRAARERLDRAVAAAQGLEAPVLEELERKAREASEALRSAIARHGALRAQSDQLARWNADLHKLAGEMEAAQNRYGVVGRISEVANGKNAPGLTFQRFVLAALLDDVLDAASRRLRRMSRGRFDLQRSRERGDQRAAAGLDLVVYDTYTGTTRPVNTLSGGESFLASLAMALGLADVVRAYAGGIRLETIFVDEGFGSLDQESLDLAFQTLVDLQEGNRLVGIISHVPELRERVDARLEVIPGIRGSDARFVV